MVRDHSVVTPFPPRAGKPRTQARSDLDIQSQGDTRYTYTASNTPIASATNTWESAREREGFSLYLGRVEE